MSCITYFNNETSGLPVYISGTTCGMVVTAITLNFGQAICMNDDYEIITCGNADIGAPCIPPITPSVTPTISLTPSVTRTPTQTPTNTSSVTPTPTPSVTIGLTPTQTPQSTQTPTPTTTTTLTSTPTQTPTKTSTQTPTPTIPSPSPTPTTTITPSNSSTPNTTPTPTSTNPGGQLFIYARYVNISQEFGYTLNGGSYIAIGEPSSSNCLYVTTISGLQNGDLISFSTLGSCAINGDFQDCPNSAGSCVFNHTFNGTTYIYITVDASNCC